MYFCISDRLLTLISRSHPSNPYLSMCDKCDAMTHEDDMHFEYLGNVQWHRTCRNCRSGEELE